MIKDVYQSMMYDILDNWEPSKCPTKGEKANEFGKNHTSI